MIRLALPVLALAALALWAWTVADIIRTPEHAFRTGGQLVWLLAVLLVPLIGVPLYLGMERAARRRDRFPYG